MMAGFVVNVIIRILSVLKCWFQWPRSLRPLAYYDHEFESHRGHGCVSVVCVVCCQVEVSAMS
jgi:hypothetical protein